jgi:hypothetical protein
MTKLATRAEVDRACAFMVAQLANGPIDWECKPWKAKRSDSQNRYLWGVVYPAFLSRLEGWIADDVHTYLLGECYGWERIEGMGGVRMKPLRRSSRMNKLEFAEYVEFCIRKGAEHGVFVPSPEEM